MSRVCDNLIHKGTTTKEPVSERMTSVASVRNNSFTSLSRHVVLKMSTQ